MGVNDPLDRFLIPRTQWMFWLGHAALNAVVPATRSAPTKHQVATKDTEGCLWADRNIHVSLGLLTGGTDTIIAHTINAGRFTGFVIYYSRPDFSSNTPLP